MTLVVLSVVEQRLDAVRAVLAAADVVEVAARAGVHRATVHRWVVRYLAERIGGLGDRSHRATVHRWVVRYLAERIGGLGDRSHRPATCPHQAAEVVEVAVVEMRREHPRWGSRRIRLEMLRKPRPWQEEGLAVPSDRWRSAPTLNVPLAASRKRCDC